MSKLRGLLVTVVLIILINTILSITYYDRQLPYYWGSTDIGAKRLFLLENRKKFNTLFVGSSKTQNQLNPLTFDKLAKEKDLEITSFNFGISGLTPLESLHIYENLIMQDKFRFKYAIVELDWIATIKYENLNSNRSFYWLNSRNYQSSVNSLWHSSVGASRKSWGMFHYTVDYLENKLNVGRFQETINFPENDSILTELVRDSLQTNHGFIPMQDSIKKANLPMLSQVLSSASRARQSFDLLKKKAVSQPFLARLKKIVELSSANGTKLYFIVPLQWKDYQYDELVPIISTLSNVGVICLFDRIKEPNFYKPAMFADPNHLNAGGAEEYTKAAFNDFYRLNARRIE